MAPGETVDRIGVDHLARRQWCVRVHPHVERGVPGVGEAPLVVVELQGRHPEVEQHPVDPVDASRPEDLGQRVVHGADQRDPGPVRRQPVGRQGERAGVSVQTDQVQVRMSRKQRRRMPAEPQRRVDEQGG
jgi:hypothetical protein